MKRPTPQALQACFAAIERAAVAGLRCPISSGPDADPSVRSNAVAALAHAGRIAVEVTSRNWRRVTILTGPNAGKRTAASPYGQSQPYQIIDKRGTCINGRFVDVDRARRSVPSAPRILSSKEIEG